MHQFTQSKSIAELLLQHDLGLGEICEVDDHEQILHGAVEHLLKLRRVNLECPRLTPAQWENVLRSIPYEEEWMDWPVAYGVA